MRTSNLKRALRRGILWCSQASPTTGAITVHITVRGERRTAPSATVWGRPTAPVSAPLPIPAAHVQDTMPVGLRPAVSSVHKTPANCRPKGEGDAAGGARHPYLNLLSLFAGLQEMVTPEAWHK